MDKLLYEDGSWWDKICYKYYDIVPNKYRPHELWYQFKCWAFKRYTTVKPRYLGHSWHDRCTIMPHMIFEILCQFIEKECSPGGIDWDHDERHIAVRKEMQDLYDWWINCHKNTTEYKYLLDPDFNSIYNLLTSLIEECEDSNIEDERIYDKNNKVIAYAMRNNIKSNKREMWLEYIQALSRLEYEHNLFIRKQCNRVIEIMDYMWT